MKIGFIPADTEDTASSRIRVYTLQRTLAGLGVQTVMGYEEGVGVLLVQKKVTPEILRTAQQARAQGCIVLYDVDDLSAALDYWVPPHLFREMLHTANLITTDTEGHRDSLQREYGAKVPVEIIPDTIDYYPSAPVQAAVMPDSPLRVMWYGSASNIALFERYAHTLMQIPDVQVVVITHSTALEEFSRRYPAIDFLPWSRQSFVSAMQSCHLTCLMHDGSEVDRSKSNNKMITSISWGVPTIVSDTPDYARTARECGVEDAVFTDERSLTACIERFRSSAARMQYLQRAQPEVWKRYSPGTVGIHFLQKLADYAQSYAQAVKTSVAQPAPEPVSTAWLVRPKPTEKIDRDRDYMRDWVRPEGVEYRIGVYERQKKDGSKPLIANPTIDEIKAALRRHSPGPVLEVGCGWGRIMERLIDEFDIYGCDISTDMLQRCEPAVSQKVFYYDCAIETYPFPAEYTNRWDVVFTRGVTLYFMENDVQMAYAMNNMLMMAAKKILIWEWPEVCERMQQFSNSPKFEYHIIEHRSE